MTSLFLLFGAMKTMLTEQEKYHWGNLLFEKKFMHYSLSTCSIAVLFLSHCSDLQILTSESLHDPNRPVGFPVTRHWVAFRTTYAFPVPPVPLQESQACACRDLCALLRWPATWAPLLGWVWVSRSLFLWLIASLFFLTLSTLIWFLPVTLKLIG